MGGKTSVQDNGTNGTTQWGGDADDPERSFVTSETDASATATRTAKGEVRRILVRATYMVLSVSDAAQLAPLCGDARQLQWACE